jgi:preprotein translocase subunit SecE
MEKLKLYLSESYEELVNKVSWPTWENLIESAKVVLVFVVISTICVFFMDVISQQVLKLIYNIG